MRDRLLVFVLVLCAGCYESHTRRASPVDGGSRVDSGPARASHPCALGPIEIADVDPLDVTGVPTIVSRGADYAVSWGTATSSGVVILGHDGRRIELDMPRARAIAAIDEGYLLTHPYGEAFWRVTAEGEPLGEPIVLPEIVPPHWQSLELHGERMHLVAHHRSGPTAGEPHVYELDLAAWTSRRSAFMPLSWGRWSFTSDRALVVTGGAGAPPELAVQGQRLRPDGTSEVVFESPLGGWSTSDVRYDPWSEGWLLAGSAGGPEPRAIFARISSSGEVAQMATFEPDPELAALIALARGARVAVAPSPIGPALALTTNYFGEETISNVVVAYPPSTGAVFASTLELGTPSAWSPAIAWSEADAGFAVVSVDRDESGRTYLALRCGLRPE